MLLLHIVDIITAGLFWNHLLLLVKTSEVRFLLILLIVSH